MPKSYRIRTKVNEDSFVRVNLEQDFDLLEILSLKLTQSDVYSRMCADYGLVVGRVMANGGLGLPNAKVAIFIPLSDKDEQDPVIKEMYPFKDVNDKNEEGYRYNLLPKTKQHTRHTPTGSMYSAEETISNPLKLEVYEKYYKYTVKTNENGDYMIWGVPLGSHQIHMSVDVSDIGCHSMKPFDFIAQGVPIEKFKNAAIFDDSENLDTLPQIVIQNKTLEVVPFWGDDGLCDTGISRVDFDLRDSNVEFKPNALLMGSILSDDNNNNVGWKCKPSKKMGNMCSMTTGSGKIEAIRFTVYKEDDGCTPKLEKFNVHNIDGSGSFVARIPMNLNFKYTDEYGNEKVSDNPSIGVPSGGKYRLRISFDQKYSSETRKGSYLIPNIREYVGMDKVKSYSFSTDLYDYPDTTGIGGLQGSPAFLSEDYFYEFRPDRVYTISQFIERYRNDYGLNFDANTISSPTLGNVGKSSGSNRWEFIGIKGTNPAYEADCSGSIKEFPANDGFRGGSFIFLMTQLNLFITILSIFLPFVILMIMLLANSYLLLKSMAGDIVSLSFLLADLISTGFGVVVSIGAIIGLAFQLAYLIASIAFKYVMVSLMANGIETMKYRLPLTKYDECEDCNCGDFFTLSLKGIFGADDVDDSSGDTLVDDPNCRIMPLKDTNLLYYSEAHSEEIGDSSVSGCYTISYDGSNFRILLTGAVLTTFASGIATALIPYGGGVATNEIMEMLIQAFIISMGFVLFRRLAKIFVALNEWRVRKNIYNGLCQGVFNLGFWNAWIRGTIYHFRFENKKNKLVNSATGTESVDDFYCRDVIIGPDELGEEHYYYRSCPYNSSGFSPNSKTTPPFTYDNGSNSINYLHKGVGYPTSIVELGTYTDLSDVDCELDEDNDFFIDKLESSSQKSSTGILDYVINQKLMSYNFAQVHFTGINNWFGGQSKWMTLINPPLFQGTTRNKRNDLESTGTNQTRLLDGDIAQFVASNNEFGIYKFKSLFYDPTEPNYGPLPNTIVDPRIVNSSSPSTVTLIPSLVSDLELRNYLIGNNGGYSRSQSVPYIAWSKTNPTGGNWDNHWDMDNVRTIRLQDGIVPLTIPTPPPYTPIDMGTATGQQTSSGFFHYYFGLYQGNNAYDQYVNKYMPPLD